MPYRRATLALAAALSLSACRSEPVAPVSGSPSLSVVSAGIEQVAELPVDVVTFVPCAMNGVGEDVALTGTLRVTTNISISPSGRATVRSQYSPRNIVGRGLSSGDAYRGNGVTINSFSAPVGKETMTLNNFQVIGQGPGNNVRVHERIAVTVNANGITSNVRIESRFSCK